MGYDKDHKEASMATGNLSLSGAWQGNPSAGFIGTMIFDLTQDGTAVTGNGTGWITVFHAVTQSWTVTGNVNGGSFTLQAAPGPITFTGTIGDANDISGEVVGDLSGGSNEKAQIACVRIDIPYPDSITGRWQGSLPNDQSVSLSLVQGGGGVSGVGNVNVLLLGTVPLSYIAFVGGTVTYPTFSLSLSSIPLEAGQITITFIGFAFDPNTLVGLLVETGEPIKLTRQ
jgi:hypothetical protein